MKKIFAFFLSLIISLSSMGVLYAAPSEGAYDQKITVVHTNDVHGNVEIEPYVKAYVDELKAKDEQVMLISAGDAFAGIPFAQLSGGQDVVKVMNMAGYDMMTLGNHETGMKVDVLKKAVEAADFPIMGAYAENKIRDGIPDIKDYVIKEFNGVKVAFIGLTISFKVENLGEYTVKLAEELKSKAEAEGATVFIGVTHLGVTDPEESKRSTYIADKCPWFTAIIDAHCHSLHETGMVRNNILIAETGEYGNNFGVMELYLKGSDVVEVNDKIIKVKGNEENLSITPNAEMQKYIDEVKTKNDVYLNQVVFNLDVELIGEREFIRSRETNFGNLVADSYIQKTDADLAFQLGPLIRTNLGPGEITRGELETSLGSEQELAVFDYTGEQIYEIMEKAVSAYPEVINSFMHISGFKVEFDPTKEAGSRILSMTLNDGMPIDFNKTYKAVSREDIIASFFNERDVSRGEEYEVGFGNGYESVIDYVKGKGKITDKWGEGRVKPVEGGTSTIVKPEGGFSDIKGHWAESFIKEFKETEILAGYEDGTFKPNNMMTRAEFIMSVAKTAGIKAEGKSEFKDVANHWAESYISAFHKAGLLEGLYSDENFAPNQNITREEMASVLYNVINYLKLEIEDTAKDVKDFDDYGKISEDYKDAVKALQQKEILVGDDNKFAPDGNMSRAEAVTVLNKLYSYTD